MSGRTPPFAPSDPDAAAAPEGSNRAGNGDGAEDGSIVLSGWLERRGISPPIAAVVVLAGLFLVFQAVGGAAGALLLFLRGGVPQDLAQENLFAYITSEAPEVLLIGNSIGQVLGLAVPVLLIVRLHTPDWRAYLRLGRPDAGVLGWSLVGWVGLVPIVQLLERLNRSLPLPDGIRTFDRRQMELVEQVLASDLGLALNLVALAVVPAICEELLFRGYVQRNFERARGSVYGFLITGLVFAIYHLRLTQLLPLALLGIYLGYVLWRSRSVWTAAAVHFANNAFAVLLGTWAQSREHLEVEAIEELPLPTWALLLGVVIAAVAIGQLERRRE